MKRYGNIDYVMHMDFKDAVKLINEATEDERKEKYWQMYVSCYPHFRKENIISFEEFYENSKPKKIDTRSKDEVMRDIMVAERKTNGTV